MAHLRGIIRILIILLSAAPAEAAPIALSVMTGDTLPGFEQSAEPQYLAHEMAASGVAGWSFMAAPSPALPPRDRIVWHFELDPYAGGGVRQYFPMPGVRRLFGTHHLITAEAMLYLDDQYQTLMFGQAAITGGAEDGELAGFIRRMTQGLLGEHGAYRSIDMGRPGVLPRR